MTILGYLKLDDKGIQNRLLTQTQYAGYVKKSVRIQTIINASSRSCNLDREIRSVGTCIAFFRSGLCLWAQQNTKIIVTSQPSKTATHFVFLCLWRVPMKKTLYDTDVLLRAQMPDDPHKEIKVKLAEFLLALIQAFLRTGYYTPDHPESQKARVGLYEDFQKLFIQKDELTFLVREDPGGINILVEGVLPDTQDLNSLMIAGMAEMYVPRLAKFLKQKDLLSLTLKSTMTRTEFTNFVDLIGEPAFVDTQRKEDKERFSKTLQDRGIFNISYIYSEELVAAERNIYWRSQIALTRLKKDFSLVPLYMNLDAGELKKVRRQIIQDVFRSFQNAEAIYSVLINTDLAVTKEFRESEIDHEIIDCLSNALLLQVSQTLLTETLRLGRTDSIHQKTSTLATHLASALNLRAIKKRESILEEYVKHNLITLEQLPAEMQRKVTLKRLTRKFLEDSKSFLIQFDKIEDPERYLRVARYFMDIIPELIHRDQYDAVHKITLHLDRHYHEKKDRSVCANHILEEISTGEIIRTLKGKFLLGKKELCLAIVPIFLKLGMRSVPQLVSILVNTQDHLVRQHACDAIAQIEPAVIKMIFGRLENEGISTGSILEIIRALADTKCTEWEQPLAGTLLGYLNQDNPHLRVEALKIYDRIKSAEGKTLYLDLLNDEDVGVQKEAILCLARAKSQSGLARILHMLEKPEDLPRERREHIEPCLFKALGIYGNIERPGIGTLEDFCLATLDRQLGLGPLKFTTTIRKGLKPKVIAAICETLANIGTDKSGGILRKLKKQKNSPWGSKAEEAVRKIAEREAKKD